MPNQNPVVLERILARKKDESIRDNYKIGLIFEGGGMKGIFSSGCAMELHRLGFENAFDIIYGSSSGSCAAAYFVSGNITAASHVYYKYLSGFRFIKPWRVEKLIDIDYLCDVIFHDKCKLNVKKLRKAKPLLKVYVADAKTAKGYVFTNRDNVDDNNLLKASCAVPGYYGKFVEVGGIEALDGNVAVKLPIKQAIEDGCTDIFIVTTSTEQERESKYSSYWIVGKPLMKNFSKKFMKRYKGEINDYNECLDIAFGRKELTAKVNIYTVSPSHSLSVAETRVNKLKKTEEMATIMIKEAFGEVKNEKINN